MMTLLLSLLGCYGLVCIGGRLAHRHFVYSPDRTRRTPLEAGVPHIQEITFQTSDGVTLIAWYLPAQAGQPTLLYFTGNGGSAALRVGKILRIAESGTGVFMLNYRGFGGSGGHASEVNNVADAAAAYDHLVSLGVDPAAIVAYGESLGTSVATQLALARSVKALVLEAPFTSIVDVGRLTWWMLPLNFVMVDQYRTLDRIADIKVPLLIMHGTKDEVIPVSHAEQLYAKASHPKALTIFPAAGHNDLYDYGAWGKAHRFIEGLEPARKAVPVRVKEHALSIATA